MPRAARRDTEKMSAISGSKQAPMIFATPPLQKPVNPTCEPFRSRYRAAPRVHRSCWLSGRRTLKRGVRAASRQNVSCGIIHQWRRDWCDEREDDARWNSTKSCLIVICEHDAHQMLQPKTSAPVMLSRRRPKRIFSSEPSNDGCSSSCCSWSENGPTSRTTNVCSDALEAFSVGKSRSKASIVVNWKKRSTRKEIGCSL